VAGRWLTSEIGQAEAGSSSGAIQSCYRRLIPGFPGFIILWHCPPVSVPIDVILVGLRASLTGVTEKVIWGLSYWH
jgi:hypothetical protein